LALFEVGQPKVEKHLPVIESQVHRAPVFAEFRAMLSGDAVGEAEMVVGKGVVRMFADNDEVAANSRWVVFHAEVVIGLRVANLVI